jgi:hypothetical protein
MHSLTRLQALLLLPLLLVAACATDTAEGSTTEAPIELLFGSPAGFSPVADPLSEQMLREVEQKRSAEIGPAGGTFELLGHRVEVPAGAVRGPTMFSIAVVPGTVEVELEAIAGGTDIGRRGFATPVRVSLSYARTSYGRNPPGVDHLTVLRVHSRRGFARFESLPTRVDEDSRTVTVELDHFSRYVLASPY